MYIKKTDTNQMIIESCWIIKNVYFLSVLTFAMNLSTVSSSCQAKLQNKQYSPLLKNTMESEINTRFSDSLHPK